MKNNFYTEDSIESLTPIEHVQLRPGMYIGSTENPNQLLLEIFSNALDEHNIGHGNLIIVDVDEKTGECHVLDEAQGFPINQIREDGKTILEASFSVLNTSGKYSDDGVYEGTSLGLNGIGAKAANFLSETFKVISWNEKNYESLTFKDGVLQERKIGKTKELEVNSKTGTDIRYLPKTKYFSSIHTDISFFKKFFNDICCLCNDLSIKFNDELIHHDSIEDILDLKKGNNFEVTKSRLVIEEKDFKLGMTFTSADSDKIIPYINYGLTDTGPHITSLKSTLTKVLNNWAKSNGLLGENDKTLDGNSLREGLLLVCNINSRGVVYNAQVKSTIVKINSDFDKIFARELELWLDSNPDDATAIIEKALIARKAAEAAKKARARIKAAENGPKKKFIDMPTTLIDATSKSRKDCELIIVEGLSAASSLVAQRNAKTTAVYSIRGMMLNVQKTSTDKIIENKEINNLVLALGLEYANGKMIFDEDKLRYGKIIAASDADPAGNEIENLLFNILWQMCPELITKGYVYSAEPPLYRVTLSDNSYHFIDDAEMLAKFKFVHSNIKDIQRAKGLAEMQPEQLAAAVLDEETRKIKQLTVSDIEATNKLFVDLYGPVVAPRVEYINSNPWGVQVDYE